MPVTPYQRVQVSTIPPVRSALERISSVTGVRVGSIVREFLEEALPALEAMADALEMVPTSPGQALAHMSKRLVEASQDAKQASLELDLEVHRRTFVQKAVRRKSTSKANKRRKAPGHVVR